MVHSAPEIPAELTLRAAVGAAAEVVESASFKALPESLLDHRSALGLEVLGTTGALRAELTTARATLGRPAGLLAPHGLRSAHGTTISPAKPAAPKLLLIVTHRPTHLPTAGAAHRALGAAWALSAELSALRTTLRTVGSTHGTTLNLDAHLTRPATIVCAPLATGPLGTIFCVLKLHDEFTLRAAGLGERGRGQDTCESDEQ